MLCIGETSGLVALLSGPPLVFCIDLPGSCVPRLCGGVMLTAVKPRDPASESLWRCSVLPELIEDGIVATAEAILTDIEQAIAEYIKAG